MRVMKLVWSGSLEFTAKQPIRFHTPSTQPNLNSSDRCSILLGLLST